MWTINRLSCDLSSSRPELLEQLWKARAEKKKLRKTIREFEEDFYQHNGRYEILMSDFFKIKILAL